MKKPFLSLSFLLVTAICLQAQTQNNNSEQTKVNQTVTRLFDGIAALDMGMVGRHSTKDFLLLEDGEIWNLDTLASKLAPLKSISFSRTNRLDFIRTEVKGTSAWVAYNNAADMTVNGQKKSIRWLESAFLVKEGKDWKIRLLHSTVLKPEAK